MAKKKMQVAKKAGRELTDREQLFVYKYCGDCLWDATAAAKAAGYSGDRFSLRQQGHQVLKRPEIKAAIQAFLEEQKVNAIPVLSHLILSAFGDRTVLGECFNGDGTVNFDKVRELGIGPLVEGVKPTKNGEELQLVSRAKAIEQLAKVFNMVKDERVVVELPPVTSLSDDDLRKVRAMQKAGKKV